MAPFDFKSDKHFIASPDGTTLKVYELINPTIHPSSIRKIHWREVATITANDDGDDDGDDDEVAEESYDGLLFFDGHGKIEGREALTKLAQYLTRLRLMVSPEGYCFQDVTGLGEHNDFGIQYLRLNDLFNWPRHGVDAARSSVWHRLELRYVMPKYKKSPKQTTGVGVSKEKYEELKTMLRVKNEELAKVREEMDEELQNLRKEKDEELHKLKQEMEEEIEKLRNEKEEEAERIILEKEEETSEKLKEKDEQLQEQKKENGELQKLLQKKDGGLKDENRVILQKLRKEKDEQLRKFNEEMKKLRHEKDEEVERLEREKEEKEHELVALRQQGRSDQDGGESTTTTESLKKELEKCRKNSWGSPPISKILLHLPKEKLLEIHLSRRRPVPPQRFRRKNNSAAAAAPPPVPQHYTPDIAEGSHHVLFDSLLLIDEDVTAGPTPSPVTVATRDGQFDVNNWWFAKTTAPEGGTTMVAYYDGDFNRVSVSRMVAKDPIPLPYSKDANFCPNRSFTLVSLVVGLRLGFFYRS
ncbi:unnamed protein product [Linum tenue]|uniref:Uncharacterized protein n=1 Tax=Linum tenue TaxID=586396 RepID=A0AAV0RAC2_9ROSI|nr:unnamed protein product [Linum tenue]